MTRARWLSLCALALLAGCQQRLPAASLVVDVRPTRLQLGETLIVEAAPVQARGAKWLRADVETRVVLDGTFHAPGARPLARRLELPALAPRAAQNPKYAERALVNLDEAVEGLVGHGEFDGRVGIWQKPEQPGQPDTAWLGGDAPVHLTLFPASMKSLSQLAVDFFSHGPMLGFLGIKGKAGPDGVLVTEVGMRASGAGVRAGDRVFKAAGHELRTPAQLAMAARTADPREGLGLGIKRGTQETAATVDLRGRPMVIPVGVVHGVVMVVFAVVALVICLVIAGTLTWVERRVAGKMQSRVGPNRVGPLGSFQWIADGIKLVLKEDIIPDAVDKPLFKLAPYLVFVGLFGTFVVLPFSQMLIISDLNVGLIYLVAITGFVAIGLMMAGWSSNNKWSLLGGMRSAAQIMSYEVPAGLALMVPVIAAGTLSTQELVERQGGWPWQWHVFDNPLVFGCFFIYFISALAEGNRTPFDLPEAESELVAGYNIEYSGWRFAVFFLSEWANLFVVGAVATTVFLGGWQVPGLSPAEQAGSLLWQALGLCFFFAKAMALVFVIIWIRWTLPRFRVDQMMRLCWKYFVPWTFAAVLFQAFWIWVAPPAGRSIVAVLTFLCCGLGLVFLFVSRLLYNWSRNPEEKWDWNPFP
jgi:NADH-quinone oxidoreductase subunit H